MNPVVTGPTRIILAVLGTLGWVVVHFGLLTTDQWTNLSAAIAQIAGALLIAGPIVWSAWQNIMTRIHTTNALHSTATQSAAAGTPVIVPPKPAV